jgi:hypothetical protein
MMFGIADKTKQGYGAGLPEGVIPKRQGTLDNTCSATESSS